MREGSNNEMILTKEKFKEIQQIMLTNSEDLEVELRRMKNTYDIFFPSAFSAGRFHFFNGIKSNWQEFLEEWKGTKSFHMIENLGKRKCVMLLDVLATETEISMKTLAIRVKNLSVDFERNAINPSNFLSRNQIMDSPFIYPISHAVNNLSQMILEGKVLGEMQNWLAKVIVTDSQFSLEKIKELLEEERTESNSVIEILIWISAFCIATYLIEVRR